MSAPLAIPETPFAPEEPQPLVCQPAPGAPYPVRALGPLRAVAEAVQKATQAPVAIPAQSALAVASLAVQGFADVETLGGRPPLSLFCLTVARSGERKSACDAPIMAAIREHERDGAAAWRARHADWQAELAVWKAQHDRLLSDMRKKGTDPAAIKASLRALGPEPKPPLLPDRTVSEPTFEGLTKLFANGQPSLGLFADEGGQFLGGHAMNRDNRQKTMSALNDLWQGHSIRRTRAGDGHQTLHGRRLALHLMVQPGVARGLLADPLAADTGFLARTLVCEPPSTIGTRLFAQASDDSAALERFAERLRTILAKPLPIDPDTGGLQPRCLALARDAHALLVDFHDRVERAMAPGGDLAHIAGVAAKAAEQAARIAGVLTLWRDLEAQEVAAADMASGIDLARFYLLEAARLADVASVSAEIEAAERLRQWLLKRWPEPCVTVRNVMNRGPNAMRTSDKALAALVKLEQHGWLVRLDPGTVVGGTPRRLAWRIVRPSSLVD